MSERPPAPPGFKWTRSILGLFGDYVLVEDDEFPLPPRGFRYVPHPLTAKPTLVATVSPELTAVEGITSRGSERAGRPKIASFGYFGTGSHHVDVTPIDPAKISPEVHAVEGITSRGS